MIKHIVLFRLKERAEGSSRAQNAATAKSKLEALRGHIPGLFTLDVAINTEANDSSYDLALYSVFESREALAAYRVHPEHQAVADFLERVRESRAVVDADADEPLSEGEAPRSSGWTGDRLLGLARAFQETRVLLSGAELDVFTLLGEAPSTAADVAAKTGANLRAMTIVLDALAAMGLLKKRENAYQTEPAVAALLSRTDPHSILPMILHSANLWTRWGGLTRMVGGPDAEKRALETWQRSFIGAMHVIASGQAGRIVELVDPGAARRLLDVGGASGSYTQAFLAASPQMRATLFDRAPVIEMAREILGRAGVLDRVTLVAGDFYTDPLPPGHDLVFVSAIIHQNSPGENIALFRKAFSALDPGGRIVVRDHVIGPDRTQPKSGALFAVNMLVAGNEGNSYTFDEIASALSEAGFGRIRLIHPDRQMDGLVEAFRA